MKYLDYIKARFNVGLTDNEGATAVEYGLMVALIAVVIIAAVTALGGALDDTFTEVASNINDAGNN